VAERTPEKSTFASTKTLGGASSLAIALARELGANAPTLFLEFLFSYAGLSEDAVQLRKGVKGALSPRGEYQGAVAELESDRVADI
jgi:hypothetical protein